MTVRGAPEVIDNSFKQRAYQMTGHRFATVVVVNVSRTWPEVESGIRTAADVVLGDWNPFRGNRPPKMAFDPGAVTTVFGYCKGFLTSVFDIDPQQPYTWRRDCEPARIRWNALPSSRWEKLRGAPSPVSWRPGEGTPVKFLTQADLEIGSRVFSRESLNEDWPKFLHWHFSTWNGGAEVPVTRLEQLLPVIWLDGKCDADKLRAFRWLANWHPAPRELKAEAEAFLASGHLDLASFLAASGHKADRAPQADQDAMLPLYGLPQRAFDAWEEARSRIGDMVVSPSVPVLFFGGAEAYFSSPLRIITVGLNPSRAEFPEEDRFRRFRAATGLAGQPTVGDGRRYLGALGGYFKEEPYGTWFATYKGLLEGMGASFCEDAAASTALHTDLCSPVATDPTWSKLPKAARIGLLGSGLDLWHDLVRVLRPDVMLVPVGREHLGQIRFQPDADWAELCRVERDNPYIVEHRQLRLDDGTITTAICGPAANTPFGTVSQNA